MGDILFLAHRVPFPPNRGDKIRAHHLLRQLAKLGRVHVGCFAETAEDRAGEADLYEIAATHCIVPRSKPLVLAGVEAVLSGKPVSLTAFHSARLEKWVNDTLSHQPVDAIVIFSGQMGQYVPQEFKGRVIIDLCDVDSAKFESYAEAGERVWVNAREARLLAREEERLGHRADATILISENEAALFRNRLQSPHAVNLQVIGNGIDADLFGGKEIEPQPAMAQSEEPHFVFTGQMDYRPNEQAALWAIEEFLPRIQASHANAQLWIVGRNPTAKLLVKHGEGGVNITGEVPDVRPYLAGADIVLAPLMIARGVQNKVLEAMAMRCPVLLTPEAATGIAAEDGRDWSVAHAEGDAMADAALRLISDPVARKAMGEAARAFVLEHNAWDAMLAPLANLLRGQGEGARNAV